MDQISLIVASMLISGAPASDGHGCSERPHNADVDCACTRVVDFYVPSTGGGGYTPPGGWPPPINVPAGPAIHVASPGFRVVGRPINVAGPVIHIDGPPVYVDAPPIRIAPAQIYVQRPDVHVRPSEIMVEPPEIHFSDCPDGTVCTPITGDGGVGLPGYAAPSSPVLAAVVPPSRATVPPPPPAPVYTPTDRDSGERMPAYEAPQAPVTVNTPVDNGVYVPAYEAPLPPVSEAGTPSSRTRTPPAVPFYPPKQDRN